MSNESQPLDLARRDASRLACTLGLHYLALAEVQPSPDAALRYSTELNHASDVHFAVTRHIRDGRGAEALEAMGLMDYERLEEAARACGVDKRWGEDAVAKTE